MDRMTPGWLTIWLSDEFHDWIDGDDPVSQYDRFDYSGNSQVWVKFESGAQFLITVEEVYD